MDSTAISAAANPIPSASCAVGTKVFYGSRNSLIEWDVSTGDVEVVAVLSARVTCVVAGSSSQCVYVGCDDGNLHLYDFKEIKIIHKLPAAITCLTTNDRLLVSGCMDGFVYVFENGQEDLKLQVKGYVLCAAICENLLVVGGTAWKLFVFDLNTRGETVATLTGHENWVRCLSFTKKEGEEDTYILASGSQERYIRLWKFTTQKLEDDVFSNNVKIGAFTITFEALLMGHDDWVLAVMWDPLGGQQLLSASSDSSLIIWQEEDGEIWTPHTRLGDVSQWGASTATGTSGGFWTGLWMDDRVLTITITGAWRVWLRPESRENPASMDESSDAGAWEAVPGPTGHLKDVTSVAWVSENLFFTTSLDQTTRLWFCEQQSQGSMRIVEVGRPQIHGYDMVAIVPLSVTKFVSAGDEKVMRVFEMPRPVAQQLEHLSPKFSADLETLPDAAAVPVLGLSNKAEAESEDTNIVLPPVPREDQLQKLTLWPEIDKVYGHGYEVCAIAHSKPLGIVISCCKSNNEQHAKLRFCSTETWLDLGTPAAGHSLTVTSLEVSPSGSKVLSCGRDRRWMLTDVETHEVEINTPKAHTRIIWDCCFVTETKFITVSRDKTLRIWELANLLGTIELGAAGTAVDCCGDVVAVGLETGEVRICRLEGSTLNTLSAFNVPGRVNRLQLSADGGFVAVASDIVAVHRINKA